MRKLLIAGNSTMPRSVGIFNLPALITCKPSPWCREHCYALQGRFIWKCTLAAHYWRYVQSLKHTFANRMIDEIRSRRSIQYVRIHISGDFYSKEYIDKWAETAREFPEMIFRTNTKRIDLLKYMKKVFPENVVVRESTDPTRKSRGVFPQAAIKGTEGSDGFFVCKDHCEKCKFYCWNHPDKNVVTSRIR